MSEENESILVKRAAYAAIVVAAILIVGKYIAWAATDSISIQASLLDSTLDILSSIINFFAVRQALKPADFQHRFGYGKVEALAGIGQSLFILGSAIWMLREVYLRMSEPFPLEHIGMATNVMGLSIVLTLCLVLFQNYVVKRTKSVAIAADCLHYKTDLLTNIGVLVGINAAVYLDIDWLDPLIGVGIIAYIGLASFQICKKSTDILLDRELPQHLRAQIIAIVRNHPDVCGVHDLKTRSAGLYEFIQMHMDVDETLSLKKAHDIAEEVELEILKIFPKAEVIIHQDPAVVTKDGFERPKSNVESWIKHKEEWTNDYDHADFSDPKPKNT